jgi:hypothetical protein
METSSTIAHKIADSQTAHPQKPSSDESQSLSAACICVTPSPTAAERQRSFSGASRTDPRNAHGDGNQQAARPSARSS